MATASRDAKSCVSQAGIPLFDRNGIAMVNCAYLLGRRKILRLYWGLAHNIIMW